SCLITGRGAAKDPHEAAKWLREAARLIESPTPLPKPAAVAEAKAPEPPSGRSIVITKANAVTAVATNPTVATTASPAPAPTPVTTSGPRVQRVDALQVVEPVLQESRPVPKPIPDLR